MKIILVLLTLIAFVGCSKSKHTEITLNSWDGLWEDGTGFWLRINVEDKELHFSRSGEQADSPTKFSLQSISEDFTTIQVIEKSDYTNYLHTLKLQSATKLQRDSFDLDDNELWGSDSLTKKKN
jgi:hypothetical protein